MTNYIAIDSDNANILENLKSIEKIITDCGAVVLDADISQHNCILSFAADVLAANRIMLCVSTIKHCTMIN